MTATARYKYESNAGNIFQARTDNDDELSAIRGNEPSGTQTEYLTFEFSKNAKEVGCRPRHVKLVREISGGNASNCLENNGKRYKNVIVLTKDKFNQINIGQTVTVDSQPYKVQAKVNERMV